MRRIKGVGKLRLLVGIARPLCPGSNTQEGAPLTIGTLHEGSGGSETRLYLTMSLHPARGVTPEQIAMILSAYDELHLSSWIEAQRPESPALGEKIDLIVGFARRKQSATDIELCIRDVARHLREVAEKLGLPKKAKQKRA